MESVRESGSHVPVIDLSTTNPLPDVGTGGDSDENLAGGGSRGTSDSPVYQRLWNDGVARFELSLAGLEGTDTAAAFSTGLALACGFSAACRFVDAVSIACHAVSLGGVDTLVQHPASLTHRPVAAGARPGDGIVRVSVGLEDVRDLEQDLTRALDQAGAADSVRSTRTG